MERALAPAQGQRPLGLKEGVKMGRTCLRCGAEMLLDLSIEMKEVADPSAFFDKLHRWKFHVSNGSYYDAVEVPLKAAVCPKCGHLEPYVACPQELAPKTVPLEDAEEKKEKQIPWQAQKKEHKDPWE